MADKTFTGPGNFNDNTKWDGSVLPNAGDTLNITAGTCTVTANDANVYGDMDIAAGIIFNFSTYNFSCGFITVNGSAGTLKGCISSDIGLTCAGIRWNSGSKRDFQIDTKIKCSGNWIEQNEDIALTDKYKGDASIIENIGMWKPHFKNILSGIYLIEGKTITLNSNGLITGASSENDTNIQGIIAAGTRICELGCFSNASFILGENCNITGSNTLGFLIYYGANIIVNKITQFSFSGYVYHTHTNQSPSVIPAADWSAATIQVTGYNAGDVARYISSGVLKCNDFYIRPYAGYTLVFRLDETNTDIEILGNVDFNIQNEGTLSLIKGNGNTWTLKGSGKTADFQNKSIANLTIDTGASYTSPEGFNCDNMDIKGSLTLTPGKSYNAVNISGAGTLSAASTVYVYYTENETFSGTLNNVVLVRAETAQDGPPSLGVGFGLKL